ncbi:MAG: hypothetical protein KAT35_02890 [Candidatus Aenigmarchaeota archaeon]|nr:hypothetical protein [Candidatus Aenigmarchaeota archaeon]
MIESTTKFQMSGPDIAKKVVSSIKPDMEFDAGRKRSDVSLSAQGRTVVLKVKAGDVAAFRATLNTYTRLIEVSRGLIENGERST